MRVLIQENRKSETALEKRQSKQPRQSDCFQHSTSIFQDYWGLWSVWEAQVQGKEK